MPQTLDTIPPLEVNVGHVQKPDDTFVEVPPGMGYGNAEAPEPEIAITITPNPVDVSGSASVTLATVPPDAAARFTAETSNEAIAVLDTYDGSAYLYLNGVAVGTCDLNVALEDDAAVTASAVVNVLSPMQRAEGKHRKRRER